MWQLIHYSGEHYIESKKARQRELFKIWASSGGWEYSSLPALDDLIILIINKRIRKSVKKINGNKKSGINIVGLQRIAFNRKKYEYIEL